MTFAEGSAVLGLGAGRSRSAVAPWRQRLLDQVSAAGAIFLGGLVVYGSRHFVFGEDLIQDVLIVACPVMMLATVLLRRIPYGVRAGMFVGSLFMLQALAAVQFGYMAGTILIALLAVGLTGLLFGRWWAIAGWGLTTAILLGAALLIDAGLLASTFDPARVDPRDLNVALRFTVTYAVLSGLLAFGVYLVVDRLSSSLDETRRALADATSARHERAQAEVDRRSAEAQFRSLVEHAPDSISILDRDHRVIFANHQGGDTPVPDPIGTRAEELVAPEFAERVRAGIERVFAGEGPVSYDVQVPAPGLGRVWYASRVGPIVEDGRVDRAIVVSSDISQRMKLEEQLLQAQKLEAVGQLTGGVAHDFNNLLTVILGNLQLVASGRPEGDPAQAFVERARDAARRGSALTDRLLAFGRKQALQPRVLDLGRLVDGMGDLLRRTLGETISVETRRAQGLWKCEVDPAQVENAVLNLAINARDAMPQGGKITIETSNVELGEEDPTPGEYVMISITDAGTGMDREVRRQAFEPFFTTKGLGRGSGLGLSMVYGFVKQSGGHVAIESELGEGTRVRVVLPRAADREEAPQASAAEGDGRAERSHKGRGELILVVEDDEDVRSLSVDLLERAGYKTIEAGDSAAALALLDRVPDVALLFSDVVLPGDRTGPQLAEVARRKRPGLPLLFTSGYVEDTAPGAWPFGTEVDLLAKPFTPEELSGKIDAALRASNEASRRTSSRR